MAQFFFFGRLLAHLAIRLLIPDVLSCAKMLVSTVLQNPDIRIISDHDRIKINGALSYRRQRV